MTIKISRLVIQRT